MILKSKRVFIVEDNLENRAIMQMLLEQNGARTAIDRWGIDTVKRLQAFAPVNLILLDLMFPNNVSGFDIFDQIRAVPAFDRVPVVAVSAMDTSVALPKIQTKGFAGFISKPIDYDTFPEQIASILAGQAAQVG